MQNAKLIQSLIYNRVGLLICPTGTFCREDRCQSYFKFSLIPSMRAPMEECEMAGAFSVLGVDSIILDAPAENISDQSFLDKVKDYKADLLIISVTFGSLEDDLYWAKKLKEELRIPIGLRGAPCYVYARQILEENEYIDFCLRGDYELILADIAYNNFHCANGAVSRLNGEIVDNKNIPYAKNLDDLALPDRSSIKQSIYKVRGTKKPQATIHVQRGCPFPCTYCLVHTVSGSQARHRSPNSIALEIKSLIDSGISYFYLRAETFTLNRKWVLETCSAIQRIAPDARWVTTTRAELVDEEIAGAMKSAGCYGISFGIDVASETIAKNVKKKVPVKQIKETMRLCDKYEIISLAYIMIGFIWDTAETIKEAESLMLNIRPDLITIHFAHPYPGTQYYEDVKQVDVKLLSLKAQSEPALETKTLSLKQLKSASRRILLKHYLRVSVIFSLSRKLLKFILNKKIQN
ncbi:MAG: radical SAM protein [Bdellovibrionota bacterium]